MWEMEKHDKGTHKDREDVKDHASLEASEIVSLASLLLDGESLSAEINPLKFYYA